MNDLHLAAILEDCGIKFLCVQFEDLLKESKMKMTALDTTLQDSNGKLTFGRYPGYEELYKLKFFCGKKFRETAE